MLKELLDLRGNKWVPIADNPSITLPAPSWWTSLMKEEKPTIPSQMQSPMERRITTLKKAQQAVSSIVKEYLSSSKLTFIVLRCIGTCALILFIKVMLRELFNVSNSSISQPVIIQK
jgi:hypothetical protein